MNESQPTFNNTENYSIAIEDNEFFTHFSNNEIPFNKNANSVLLKFSPSLAEFKIIEKIVEVKNNKQNFLKFFWPEDIGIHVEVFEYLNQNNYQLGKSLLMMASPQDLLLSINSKIKTENISSSNFHFFADINYQEDLKINQKHAETANLYYNYQFKFDKTNGLLAYLNNHLVGSVIIISSDNYLEVDNLLTVTNCRKMGVASALLNKIKNRAIKENKKIILRTDAEDFPKNIYQKMGFKVISSQIEIQKELAS